MKNKNFTLLVLSIFVSANSFTQAVIQRQKTVGGNFNDVFTSMDLTRDGGLIVGGFSESNIFAEKTDTSRGGTDYWIVKFNRAGQIEWDKTIGGSDYEYFYAVRQTSDGGYILGGSSYSDKSGEKTQDSRGDNDYWIVKLDSNGNVQWDKTIGGSAGDFLFSLEQTTDGGYILGGSSYSDKSGEKTENSRGEDYWIVKLDSAGSIQWDKTIGADGDDFFNSLEQTKDGGYIISGTSGGNISGHKTENSKGGVDYWIIKLAGDGSIEWDKTIGGSSTDQSPCVRQTSDGGYILGGTSISEISGDKTEHSIGTSYDYWVVKINELGNIEWDKTIGGSRSDWASSILQTLNGGYIIAGYSDSNISGQKTEESRGRDDYWVVKITSNGSVQWDKTIGGYKVDQASDIIEVGKNKYLVGGTSNSTGGDKTQGARKGSEDYWIVELQYKKQDSIAITASSNTNNLKVSTDNINKPFTLYPNPAKNKLHVQINGKATFTLTDQSGKILLTKTINNKGDINIANLAAGLYYLKNNATGVVKKVFITK